MKPSTYGMYVSPDAGDIEAQLSRVSLDHVNPATLRPRTPWAAGACISCSGTDHAGSRPWRDSGCHAQRGAGKAQSGLRDHSCSALDDFASAEIIECRICAIDEAATVVAKSRLRLT